MTHYQLRVKNFSLQIQVLRLVNAFCELGVLAVLYENRKSCLTFQFSIKVQIF
jgi:hypothetical protein